MIANYYEQRFQRLMDAGEGLARALEGTALAYLDGKPARHGNQKVTREQRHIAFWSCSFLTDLPAPAWQSQSMMLALAQYMGQERVSNMVMLANVAAVAPDVLIRAARCSGLILTQYSPRRTELDQLAASEPSIAELCNVLEILTVAHRERQGAVAKWQNMLTELSPFEFLSYASLYAFEHLVLDGSTWLPHRPTRKRTCRWLGTQLTTSCSGNSPIARTIRPG